MEPLFISLLLVIPMTILGTWLYYLRLRRRPLSQLWIVRHTKNTAQNMSTPGKYVICIGIGVLAEIGIPFLFVILAFALNYIHIEVSRNVIIAFSFPYFFCADLQTGFPLALSVAFFIASLLQWPIYGWILGSGWAHHRFLKYAVILASIHIMAAIVAYCYWSKHSFDMFKGCSLG